MPARQTVATMAALVLLCASQLALAAQIEAVIDFIYQSQTSPPGVPAPIPATLETATYTIQTERLVTGGLTSPWAIEFVNKCLALISDNDGELFWLRDNQLDPRPITGLPPVDLATSTGGLMDIALDPTSSWDASLYVLMDDGTGTNCVAARCLGGMDDAGSGGTETLTLNHAAV